MSYVFDNSASVAFAILISIFAVSVNFLWQRQEFHLQFEWDMVREEEGKDDDDDRLVLD